MSLLTYQDARPWARSIKEKVVLRVMPPWHIDRNVGINKFKDDPSLTDAEIATISNWVDHGAPEGNRADLPAPRKFSDLDKWHIGKPDLVVSMAKPYVLKANGQDEYYDIDVDPHFTEDMYVAAVETKPDTGFEVVHHATTNLVEDPEEDPIGLFLNEYAVGKNADIFPTNAGRLIRAGSKIHFNLHLHPNGKETPVNVSLGLKLYPKGVVPKYMAFTQHMGDVDGSRHSGRAGGAQRRLFPAAEASDAFGVPAALPHARQGAVHGGDLSGRARRFGAAGSGADRDAELREQLPVRLEPDISVCRGCRAAAARGDGDSRDHVARQHGPQSAQSESEELGGIWAADHRRDEFRVGQPVLSGRGGLSGARAGEKGDAGSQVMAARRFIFCALAALMMPALAPAQPPSPTYIPQTKFARGQDVQPTYEGWIRNADGSATMVFGYLNRNWEEELAIPAGPDNKLEPGEVDRGQPTYFLPRRQAFVFRVQGAEGLGAEGAGVVGDGAWQDREGVRAVAAGGGNFRAHDHDAREFESWRG